MIELASRMDLVHSDIRGELYREAMAMQASGTPVLKLNTGNPAASPCRKAFATPSKAMPTRQLLTAISRA